MIGTTWIALCLAGASPPDDLSWMRGANYVPSYARNDVGTWADFDPAVIDRELGFAERLRLNTVRTFLQVAVYERDPRAFLERFESFLSLCAKHRIRAMPVVFDSCFGAFPSLATYRSDDWVANPGQDRLGEDQWPKLEAYVRDVVGSHRDDDRIVLWDVMNEPTCTSFNSEADRARIWTFLDHFLDRVRAHDPRHPRCVGVESSALIPKVLDKVEVLAFHDYTRSLREDIRAVKDLAARHGKAAIINEVVMRPGQTFAFAMPILEEERIGWCFWELVLGKTQFSRGADPIQGVVYPDGTYRDPAEVACIVGIYPPAADRVAGADGFSAGWTMWHGDGPRECRLRYANAAGERADLRFFGTAISLVHKRGPDCGIARILVDGKPAVPPLGEVRADPDGEATVDTYAPDVEWNHVLPVARGLPQGAHVLTVIVAPGKNAASTDSYVQVVGIDVVTR
jgi:hypothetical protein